LCPEIKPLSEDEMVCNDIVDLEEMTDNYPQQLEVGHAASVLVVYTNECQAHGGSYSIYYALAVASKEITVDHR
jgi:hypothetical protein